ncbi:hypothetical protein U1Q18_045236 [Sarracenia purpurea var. burkii]
MHEALEINDRNRNGTGNEVFCNILDGESAPLTNVRRKFTGDLISDQAEDLEVPEGVDARRYLVGDAFLVGDYAGADTVGGSGSSSFLPCSQPFGLLPVRGWVGEDGVDRVRSGLLCAVSNFGSRHRVLRDERSRDDWKDERSNDGDWEDERNSGGDWKDERSSGGSVLAKLGFCFWLFKSAPFQLGFCSCAERKRGG